MNVVMTLEEWYDRKIQEASDMEKSYSTRTDYCSVTYWRGVRKGFIEAKEILTKVKV